MGLIWLEVILQSKGSPVQFLVRAHAWVAGSVPGGDTYQRQKGEGGREEDRGGINGDRRHDLGW